tara:strand:+ start:940 stop:1518 length:579 start_codon:yes stop_codon:yes gene_type:complete
MSPWAYLGALRFYKLQEKYGFIINHYPLNILKLFNISGGLPLSKRSEQRKIYRMMELKRWQKKLNLPINFNPKYFPPSDVSKASCIILSIKDKVIQNNISYLFLKCVWVEEKDIGNENTLLEVCESLGLNSGDLFKESEKAQDKYNSLAEKASIKNVFGSPSYILNSEVFWGQDRLDLLEEAILRNISNESK